MPTHCRVGERLRAALDLCLILLRTYLTAHITNVADEYDQPMAVFELAMDMLGT